MWRDKVVEEAKTWLNTPYANTARLKGVGVDCGQLVLGVYENCGLIPHVETGTYSPEWHLHRDEELYLKWVNRFWELRTGGQMEKGDIIVYQYGRCQSHGGIYIGHNEIIHSYVGMGVIQSNLNDSILLDKKGHNRMTGVYTLKKGV